MATIVNARDVLLQAAASRLLGVTVGSNVSVPIPQVPGLDAAITGVSLTGTSSVFQIPKAGTPVTPTSITVTATLRNLTGTPTLTLVAGTMSVSPSLTGGQFTFTESQMTSDGVTLRLSLSGYTSDFTIVKVREGVDGATGASGASATTFTGSSTVSISGNTITKIGGGDWWGAAQAYSVESYTGAAQCSFRVGASASVDIMAGLTTDPEANASYATIDYAWYAANGSVIIYENGTDVSGLVGSHTTSTVFSINYDGAYVRYYLDGVLKREVAVTAGQRLYFDSSFVWTGSSINSVTFGPSAVAARQQAQSYLYAWSTAQPANPNGSSTYTWSSASHSGFSGPTWSTAVGSNPGSPGIRLWVAQQGVSAPAGISSSTVTWPSSGSGYSVYAASVNGASAPTATVIGSNLDTVYAGFTNKGVTLSNGYTTNAAGRGHLLVVWDLASDTLVSGPVAYDTYVDGTAGLVSVLSTIPTGRLVMLYTDDACTHDAALRTALQDFGGGSDVDLWSSSRISHAFIGMRGLQPGQAYWATGPYSASGDRGLKRVDASYTATSLVAKGATGATGTQGANGLQSSTANVYAWAPSIPSGPTGFGTYTWASSSHTMPSEIGVSWFADPGTSPSAGYTLWRASVTVSDSAVNATTGFNWTSSIIRAIGYAGTQGPQGPDGAQGAQGTQGASARTAYSRIAGNPSPVGGNISTAGASSFPTSAESNSTWGLNVNWTATDPVPTSTNTLYQTDGFYNPATGLTVWNTPYISSLKVGSLSAITVNTGALTADGNITTTSGYIVGGDFTGWGWPGSGGTGFALGSNGLLLGNFNGGKFFQVTSTGNLYAPQFSIVDGAASFSGNLSAASGSFTGSLSSATGTFSGTLSAGAVTGSTITGTTVTGGLIQTASSGTRITLNEGGSNDLRFYSSVSGTTTLVGRIGDAFDSGLGYAAASFGVDSNAQNGVFGLSGSGYGGVFKAGGTGIGLRADANSNFAARLFNAHSSGVVLLVGSALSSGHGITGSGPYYTSIGTGAADGYLRVAGQSTVGTVLDTSHVTISSSLPSGGNDGDIWITT